MTSLGTARPLRAPGPVTRLAESESGPTPGPDVTRPGSNAGFSRTRARTGTVSVRWIGPGLSLTLAGPPALLPRPGCPGRGPVLPRQSSEIPMDVVIGWPGWGGAVENLIKIHMYHILE